MYMSTTFSSATSGLTFLPLMKHWVSDFWTAGGMKRLPQQ